MIIVGTDELKALIAAKGTYALIDVREADELSYGMIPTAKHIPLGDLEEAFDLASDVFEQKYQFSKMQKNDLVIFHCRTSGRSAVATQLARTKGFINARNYKGSIWAWAEIDPHVKRYGPPPRGF